MSRLQAKWRAEKDARLEASNDNVQGSGAVSRPIAEYAGLYEDPWFGEVDILQTGNELRFQSRKMVKMAGILTPFDLNTFIVKWDDPEFRADAYMRFEDELRRRYIRRGQCAMSIRTGIGASIFRI